MDGKCRKEESEQVWEKLHDGRIRRRTFARWQGEKWD
jgi:hypothetical protein